MEKNLLHHISLSVSDIEKSARFYDVLLKPLGFRRVCEAKDFVGYGTEEDKDKFALKKRVNTVSQPSPGFHVAFSAPTHSAIDQSYSAAINCGGTDNGAPGLREHYGPHYYAAFVIDPDGYEIEVVKSSEE